MKKKNSTDAPVTHRTASSCVHPRGILVLGVCQVNYQNCDKIRSNLNQTSKNAKYRKSCKHFPFTS